MNIKDLEVFIIKKNEIKINNNYPRPSFFKDGFVFFKLTTSKEIFGLGEPNPYSGSVKEIRLILLKHILPLIKYKEIKFIDLKKITLFLKKNIKNAQCLYSCLAALSNAIYDIKAKENNESVADLLRKNNFRKKAIDAYASGGMIFENQSYDMLIDEALKYKEKQFIGWKFRPKSPLNFLSHQMRIKNPPTFNSKELISFSQKLRLAVGSKFKLMIDFGTRCKNIKDANYLIEALTELDFFFIEEPLKRNIQLYQKLNLTNRSKKKIAVGEHMYEKKDIFNWIKSKKISIFQFDSNMISLTDLFFLHSFIKERKINFISHNWCNMINVATNLNFMGSINKTNKIIEHSIYENPYNRLFKNNLFILNKGKIFLKNSVGLGIDLNYKIIKKFL
jgi:L-alanine-DL-glutamate epimerase-like enolase superfamily enzyme